MVGSTIAVRSLKRPIITSRDDVTSFEAAKTFSIKTFEIDPSRQVSLAEALSDKRQLEKWAGKRIWVADDSLVCALHEAFENRKSNLFIINREDEGSTVNLSLINIRADARLLQRRDNSPELAYVSDLAFNSVGPKYLDVRPLPCTLFGGATIGIFSSAATVPPSSACGTGVCEAITARTACVLQVECTHRAVPPSIMLLKAGEKLEITLPGRRIVHVNCAIKAEKV